MYAAGRAARGARPAQASTAVLYRRVTVTTPLAGEPPPEKWTV